MIKMFIFTSIELTSAQRPLHHSARIITLILFVSTLALSSIDECTESPTPLCQNGGTCNNTDTGYDCICTPEWSGKNCEQGK